jgi:hypothetical protein
MARDVMNVFCKGEGRRFGGTVCQYFEADTGECRLLRDDELKGIFEEGRCTPFEMVKRALSRHLEKYRDVINPIEHLDAMAFEVAFRLTSKRLKQGFQIYVLQGYINRTVYCSVIEMLRREDPLVKRQCGTCKQLSPSRPHVCQRTSLISPTEGELDNPFYETRRNQTDKACKYGFEPMETTSLDASPGLSSSLQSAQLDISQILISDMIRVLAQRASEAEGKRARKRAERQYVVFCQLVERCKRGESHQEAVKAIAGDLGVSIKTIQRETSEVKSFFVQAGVLKA